MSRPGFPLVAILPDLWTVYRGNTPVSQHATLLLAVAHTQRLVMSGHGQESDYSLATPEHSQSAIQLAREAINQAKASSRSTK